MSHSIRHLVIAATGTMLLFGGTMTFAGENASPNDLNDYLCKDVMRLSGDDRENTLAFVHGYRLGKKNTTQFDVAELSALTDRFIEHCLDKPNDKALAAFEKLGN
jgi:hypothetical protein